MVKIILKLIIDVTAFILKTEYFNFMSAAVSHNNKNDITTKIVD